MTAPLAVSLGDPAGVGPELLAEAWSRRGEEGLAPFFAVGGRTLLARAAERRGLAVPIRRIADRAAHCPPPPNSLSGSLSFG